MEKGRVAARRREAEGQARFEAGRARCLQEAVWRQFFRCA